MSLKLEDKGPPFTVIKLSIKVTTQLNVNLHSVASLITF